MILPDNRTQEKPMRIRPGRDVPALLFAFSLAWGLPAYAQSSDATVKLTTKLGVETSFVAKYPFSSAPRPVERLLHQFKPGDDPGVLLELTPSSFLIVPLGAIKTAALEGGKTRLLTSVGDFTGKLASGLTTEGDRRYDLSSAVKLEVSHPKGKRANGTDPALKPRRPAWRVSLPARPERTFDITDAEIRFGFYSTAGYVVGGSDTFYDSGQQDFKLRVGGEDVAAQLSDFAEIEFFHAAGKLMARLKAPKGQVTSGEFVVTQTDSRGEHVGHTRFMVGRLLQANACFLLVGDGEPSWKITRIEQ